MGVHYSIVKKLKTLAQRMFCRYFGLNQDKCRSLIGICATKNILFKHMQEQLQQTFSPTFNPFKRSLPLKKMWINFTVGGGEIKCLEFG